MSGRVYVIADLHFGHAKVAAARGFSSVVDHDRAIIDGWNRVVDKRDVVYVLGDVFRLDRVQDLLGVKKLALGNHDQAPVAKYAALFSKVQMGFQFDGCILTHIPVHPSQFARWEMNIHGHTHMRMLDDPRYVPVSVEHCWKMEPMLLRDLISERRAARVASWRRRP